MKRISEMELKLKPVIRSILTTTAFAAIIATIGCTGSVVVGYRAYDPYRADYHVWDANEGVFYNQWVIETHQNPHRDYRRMRKDEQRAYWQWRHNHADRR